MTDEFVIQLFYNQFGFASSALFSFMGMLFIER